MSLNRTAVLDSLTGSSPNAGSTLVSSAAHCTRRRPEEESEPRREGASEVEGEGTSEGGNAARKYAYLSTSFAFTYMDISQKQMLQKSLHSLI